MIFPQSTYSLSLKMADDAGYWDEDVIPEDWHMFLKCFYSFRGQVDVEPIFLPTGNDAVECRTYAGSLKMAYVQHRRHAWGSSDVPYMLRQWAAHPEIDARRKARRLAALFGNHLIWATHWFILSLGWILPIDDTHYRITVAVAGFAEKDLNVELHDGVLTISGKREEGEQSQGKNVLYQGIAGRAFERRFQLAEHVEVKSAKLENGLLHVALEQIVPEEKKPRRISINAPELKTIEGTAKAAGIYQ